MFVQVKLVAYVVVQKDACSKADFYDNEIYLQSIGAQSIEKLHAMIMYSTKAIHFKRYYLMKPSSAYSRPKSEDISKSFKRSYVHIK